MFKILFIGVTFLLLIGGNAVAQVPVLNGVFNCKIVESKRWVFDPNTEWAEKDYIVTKQFNLGYGIKSWGFNGQIWLESLDWERVRIGGSNIDLKPEDSPHRKLQFYNWGGRVRVEEVVFQNGKFIWANRFHFDQGFISVTDRNSIFELTKVSEDEWMGTNLSWWSGKVEQRGATYITILSCKHELNVLNEMYSHLHEQP